MAEVDVQDGRHEAEQEHRSQHAVDDRERAHAEQVRQRAMNVYSIVPSHRSHATVSVSISNTSPRYDHTTAPIRRTIVSRFTFRGGSRPPARPWR